jgi:hypothetical protein
MTFKYVILDTLQAVNDVPVFFPTFVQHDIVAARFGGVTNVIAAGKWKFDGKHFCYGKSLSLKLPSRDGVDTELIRRAGMIE